MEYGTFVRWVLVIALAALMVRLVIAPSLGYEGLDSDLIEHKQAMHLALTQGIDKVYLPSARNDPALSGRQWDGGYFTNQPPLIFYLRYIPVALYRVFSPAGFDSWSENLNYVELAQTDLMPRLLTTRGFTVALKLPAILADAAITFGVALFLRTRMKPQAALAAAAGYGLNPGIVFDTAFWGQHDAIAAGLVCLSLLVILRRHLEIGWAAYALAGLTKPQAVAFAPLILMLGFVHFPLRRIMQAAAVAFSVVFLVFMPFIIHGTLTASVVAIWRSTIGGEPFVSCNANNVWWLIAGGNGYQHPDTIHLGIFTPRTLGLLAVIACNLLLVWRLGARRDMPRTFFAGVIAALSFFLFSTELHENHGMAVIPLLAFALPADRRLWVSFIVLSVTFLLNLALFDPAVLNFVNAWMRRSLVVRPISLGAAIFNVAAFAMLWAIYWRQRSE